MPDVGEMANITRQLADKEVLVLPARQVVTKIDQDKLIRFKNMIAEGEGKGLVSPGDSGK